MTAVIAEKGGRIVWNDFAEVWWDWGEDTHAVFETAEFEHIGPFYFGRQQYVDVLRNPPRRPVRLMPSDQ
jgi:hypothetical protein